MSYCVFLKWTDIKWKGCNKSSNAFVSLSKFVCGCVDVSPPSVLKVFVLLSDSLFNETLDCFSVQCDLSAVYEAMIQKLGSASALRVIWGSSCTVAQMTL